MKKNRLIWTISVFMGILLAMSMFVSAESDPYDLNEDGKIDLMDLIACKEQIEKPNDYSSRPSCDLNRDNEKNVKDILLLIDVIIGKENRIFSFDSIGELILDEETYSIPTFTLNLPSSVSVLNLSEHLKTSEGDTLTVLQTINGKTEKVSPELVLSQGHNQGTVTLWHFADSKVFGFDIYRTKTFSYTFDTDENTYSCDENTLISAPTSPSKNGYSFLGWLANYEKEFAVFPYRIQADTSFQSQWDLIPYSVSYILNGGIEERNPTSYTAETETFSLLDPVREGYIFLGWTYSGQTEPTRTVTIEKGSFGAKTFEANWEPEKYTIVYHLNGGENSSLNPDGYDCETVSFSLSDPTRTGYSFLGWTFEEQTKPVKIAMIEKGSKGPKEFTAHWSPVEYPISYTLNGGTNAPGNPAFYTIESQTFSLGNPTRAGFLFTGWTYAGQNDPVKDVLVEKGSFGAKTFSANWEALPYTITYELNGGTNAASNPTTYYKDTATFMLTSPTKEGYVFAGWTFSGQMTPLKNVWVEKGSTGNKTFTAHWTVNSYSILYNLDGGMNAPENPISYTIETPTFLLAAPTKEGYRFIGWTYLGQNEPTLSAKVEQGSVGIKTFMANWELIDYSIRYELDGGINSAANPTNYNVKSLTIFLSDPTKENYVFDGWTYPGLHQPTKNVSIPKGSVGDKFFAANWKPLEFPITYQLNGGTNSPLNPSSYHIETQTFILAEPSREGYEFIGWTCGQTATPTKMAYVITGTTGALSFTANWEEMQYDILYMTDGGVNAPGNPVSYTVSSSCTFAKATKENYTFLGWFTDPSFQTPISGISAGRTGDLVLYAKWEYGTEGLHYGLVGNEYTVSGYSGTSENLIIPSSHSGLPVTAVMENAMQNNKTIKSLTLSDSIGTIGNNAFNGCSNLQAVVLPANLEEVNDRVFCGCTSLASINFGSNLKTIGLYAFADCKGLVSLVIPEGVEGIRSFAFSGCSSIVSLFVPDSVIAIGDGAFRDCNSLKNVTLPFVGGMDGNSTFDFVFFAKGSNRNIVQNISEVVITNGTTIPGSSFEGMSTLTSVTISEGVTEIGGSAFKNCQNLKSLSLPGSLTNFGSDIMTGVSNDIYRIYDNGYYLGNVDNPYLVLVKAIDTSISFCTIHPDTKIIAGNAFKNCKQLKLIVIPDKVESISNSAFENCTAITEVTLGKNVKLLDSYAFSGCSAMVTFTMSDTVETVNTGVFTSCNNLKNVRWSSALKNASNLFPDASALVFTKYDNALYLGNEKNPYLLLYRALNSSFCDIHPNTRLIGEHAFSNCSYLKDIIIPDEVICIGNNAFDSCSALENITIGKAVESIGNYVFVNCSSLTELTIPDTVKYLNFNAINGCKQLMKLTVGTGVVQTSCEVPNIPKLEYNMYDNGYYLGSEKNPYQILVKSVNTQITSCVIHKDTKVIVNKAFENCTLLQTIDIPNGVNQLSGGVFERCSNLNRLNIPESVQEYGITQHYYTEYKSNWSYGNSSLSLVKYDNHITYLPDNWHAYRIGTVYLPDSIRYIGQSYLGTRALKHIYYSGTRAQWDAIVKYKWNCVNLYEYSTPTIHCTDGDITT